jgi:hypothetical protein
MGKFAGENNNAQLDDGCDAITGSGITNTTECLAGWTAAWNEYCHIGQAKYLLPDHENASCPMTD